MEVDDDTTSMKVTTSNKRKQDYDDIIMEDYVELDFALITYALNVNRLVFITNPKNWAGFYSANTENVHKFLDYTPQQLNKRFIEHVLPIIYEYELTESEEHLISLLELHPNFSRTEQGFMLLEPPERITLPQNEAIIQRIVANYSTNENNIDSLNNQIIVSPTEQDGHSKFQLNEENAAFLSVTLSRNADLLNCKLLPIPELRKRLKEAKKRFENCGEQPENTKISIDELVKKLKTLAEMKGKIMQAIDERFEV